jgi:uncharacterized lipoprotein YddW (UPF0748 family)
MKRVLYIFCITIGLAFCAPTANAEYRALWITRFELGNSANISAMIQTAASNNFNALFVQVCGRGTAYYNSAVLPKDDTLASDYDPLALVIQEAKKSNIEVHAWINALYVWSDKQPPRSAQHVVNSHPEWLMKNLAAGQDGTYYLDPANPAARQHVVDVYTEIIRLYPIDGIHLDYIRYPGQDWGYSDFARKDFAQKQGVDPTALILNKPIALRLYGKEDYAMYVERWKQYRTDAVSRVVRDVYQAAGKLKPSIKVSAAVIPELLSAQGNYFQDWNAWLEEGTLDIVVPMVYDTNNLTVEKQIVMASETAEKHDRMILIGLGAWRRTPKEIANNIAFTRTIRNSLGYKQLGGFILFSYDGIIPQEGYLPTLHKSVLSESAAIPVITTDKVRSAQETTENINEMENIYYQNITG